MKYLVVGVSTSCGNVQTWHFDDLDFAEKFSKQLVLDSCRSVFIIEGKMVKEFELILSVKEKKRSNRND